MARSTGDETGEAQAVGTANNLYALGLGPFDIWVAGNGGTILRHAR